jgi:hypothetical protein
VYLNEFGRVAEGLGYNVFAGMMVFMMTGVLTIAYSVNAHRAMPALVLAAVRASTCAVTLTHILAGTWHLRVRMPVIVHHGRDHVVLRVGGRLGHQITESWPTGVRRHTAIVDCGGGGANTIHMLTYSCRCSRGFYSSSIWPIWSRNVHSATQLYAMSTVEYI